MYKHSNELEEVAVVNLIGVNMERNPEMESLLGVRRTSPAASDTSSDTGLL